MMGTYPIGSVVELSNGAFGLVMDYPEESERNRPLVLLLEDDGKGDWHSGKMIYLADQEIKDGPDGLNIVRTMLPNQLRIKPAEFFLHIK